MIFSNKVVLYTVFGLISVFAVGFFIILHWKPRPSAAAATTDPGRGPMTREIPSIPQESVYVRAIPQDHRRVLGFSLPF